MSARHMMERLLAELEPSARTPLVTRGASYGEA
jgi:hypothetical protein